MATAATANEIAEAADQLTELAAAAAEQPQEVAQDSNQFDSAPDATEQKRENSTAVSFSRLDPNRRSLSSPNILQLQSQQQQQQQQQHTSQTQSSLHDAIKRKLKRQLRPNSLVYFKIGSTNSSADSSPANQQNQLSKTPAASTKRRRTALGLISSASNRPVGGCAATSCSGGSGGSSGWRNWFLSSSSSNAARSQQEGVKKTTALELAREAHNLAENLSAANSNCGHAGQEQPLVSSVDELREGCSWPSEPSPAGAKRPAQASNKSHSADSSSSRRTDALSVDPNGGGLSSIVSICMAPSDQDNNRKWAHRDAGGGGEQTKWQTSSATGPKTNVILIQHKQTAPRQQASSQALTVNSSNIGANNSLEFAPNNINNNNKTGPKFSEGQTSALEMITTSGGGSGVAGASQTRPSLVDMLVDSQLDWRQLISEANEGLRLSDHLSALQIKRQEIIHELIQTERHHCLTLALMRQVYLVGLLKLNEHRQRNNQPAATCYGPSNLSDTSQQQLQAANSSAEPIDIERLLPALEELIQAHELFFAHLRLRLVECCSRDRLARHMPLIGIIGPLGDLLIDQFKLLDQQQVEADQRRSQTNRTMQHTTVKLRRSKAGRRHQQRTDSSAAECAGNSRKPSASITNGQKLLQAYAKFCGQHYESSRYFKQLMQHDKGFKQFIEHCNKQHAACRQRGIPECNLLVAQRLTKYPLLIEQLIKASKDEPNDEEEKLKQALGECRALLAELNSQLARKESFERLLDIYAQFSPKSYTIFNHKSAIKFTKHDLLQHKRLRQLLHTDDQVRIFNATRQKLFPVLCLILNDIVVFLRVEHNHNHNSHNNSHQIGLPAQQVARAASAAAAPEVMAQHQAGSLNCHAHPASLGPAHESSLTHQTMPTTTTTTTTNNATTTTTTNNNNNYNQQQVAYYFANIDNKSSVISLSNLIVREKAVVDPEPRSYLISNSLEQPEMYEVAFTSRRHQTNFVEKLKSAIEQHIKHKLNADHHHHRSRLPPASSCRSLATSSTNTCSLSDSSAGSSVGSLFESYNSSSSSSSSGRAPSSNSSSDSDREFDQDEEEERALIETTNSSGQTTSKLKQQVAMAPLAVGIGKTHNSNNNNNNSLKRANSMRRSKQLPQIQLTAGGKLGGSKLDELAEDMDNLALDIEQELLPEPPRLSSSPSEVSPSCGDPHDNDGNENRAGQLLSSESAPPGGQQPNCPPSPQVAAAESPSPDEELPVLESGLSGRARDSCDDLSSSRLYQTPGGLMKGSKNHRRRRFQRPRQVSNQSSDSCQSGATSGTSLTSGLGTLTGDEATLTASDISTDMGQQQKSSKRHEEDHDSGRGHDDSSSSASCNDSMTLGGEKPPAQGSGDNLKPLQPTDQHQVVAGETIPEVDTPPISKLTTTTVAETRNPALTSAVAPSNSEASSKRQLLKQQRKLSTVSTISNQKRLMQTLRSVGLLTSSNQSQHQPNQDQQLVLCQNCSIKFHRSQLEQAAGQVGGGFEHQQRTGEWADLVVAAAAAKRYQQQLRRRSFFDPEQKLEEIRDSRIQLDKDKSEWREKFSRQQEQLLDERRDLDLAREQLKREKVQVEIERQQLYRKLDILKENGILLSPSHKVIITAPNSINSQQAQQQQHYSGPNGVLLTQQPTQQQQHQALYATYGNLLQQPQLVANGAKVPMHLSQESSSQQTSAATSQLPRSSLIGALPGASFLVRRFGGGGGGCDAPPPLACNLSQCQSQMPSQHQLDRSAL